MLFHRTHAHAGRVFPLLSPTTQLTEVVKQARGDEYHNLAVVVFFFFLLVGLIWFCLHPLQSFAVGEGRGEIVPDDTAAIGR